MSEEQKRKISEALRGRRLPNAHKRKISRGVIRHWALRERQ
jgi:hypothetical protein